MAKPDSQAKRAIREKLAAELKALDEMIAAFAPARTNTQVWADGEIKKWRQELVDELGSLDE
jgi:hypothetical protein